MAMRHTAASVAPTAWLPICQQRVKLHARHCSPAQGIHCGPQSQICTEPLGRAQPCYCRTIQPEPGISNMDDALYWIKQDCACRCAGTESLPRRRSGCWGRTASCTRLSTPSLSWRWWRQPMMIPPRCTIELSCGEFRPVCTLISRSLAAALKSIGMLSPCWHCLQWQPLRTQHRCLLMMRCMTCSAANSYWSSSIYHRLQWPTLSTYQLASPEQGGSTA